MVIKERIDKIKKALPQVEHVVLFYNDGFVFQSDFGHSVNIPKIGENLSELLSHMRSLYKVCSFTSKKFQKLLFETDDVNVLILNIGENINVALFFRRITELTELNISNIKKILLKIESLTDIGYIELEEKELDALEEKEETISNELDVLEKKEEKISDVIESHSKKKKEIEEEIKIIEEEKEDVNGNIDNKKEKIEEEKEKYDEVIDSHSKKKKEIEEEIKILEEKKKDVNGDIDNKKEKIEELKEKFGDEEFSEDLD